MSGIALKGRRAPWRSRAVSGWPSDRLQWMMENGLAWRGQLQPDWRFQPRNFRAWVFFLFRMLPRAIK